MGGRWQRAAVAGAVAVLALGGCTVGGEVAGDEELPAVALEDVAPGTLLQAREVDPHPSLARIGARLWQVRYASRSVLGDVPIEVSGVVIEPAGLPPLGGWPVVSYAHGTTGLADACAPSRSPTLFGQLSVVLPLVERGYVVTATDYEGLGTPGPHPYLQPVSEARGVIDAVGAARDLLPRASERWVAFGLSQGGQAAWAAGELAVPGFLGAAALAPPTDVGSLVDEVPKDLGPLEKTLYPAVLLSLQLRHPSLDLADYLSGGALAAAPRLTTDCTTVGSEPFPDADFEPSSPAALAQLRAWLDELALPSAPAVGPLFVAAGTADELVPVETVDVAVAQACALGTTVEYRRYDGEGHPALPAATEDTLRWITARFAGEPPPSTC